MSQPPLPPSDDLPTDVPALHAMVRELQATVALLQEQVRLLTQQVERLSQKPPDSRTSHRPPSSDPPWRDRPQAPPSGKKRGGQKGHPGKHRRLLPAEQVERTVVVVPEACGHCGRSFPATPARRPKVRRRQVAELPPLRPVVTEYQLQARRCGHCHRRTWAELPPGVGRRCVGPRVQAVAPRWAFYRLDRHRSRKAFESLLAGTGQTVETGQTDPLLITDRNCAYGHLPTERRSYCRAHLCRDFRAAAGRGGVDGAVGSWVLEQIGHALAPWHRFQAGGLGWEACGRECRVAGETLRAPLEWGREKGSAPLRALCRDLLEHWASLWVWLTVEEGEPTNNAAERALRPAVLWRKGSFGHQSEDGEAFVERMLTVSGTCGSTWCRRVKRQSLEPPLRACSPRHPPERLPRRFHPALRRAGRTPRPGRAARPAISVPAPLRPLIVWRGDRLETARRWSSDRWRTVCLCG